MSKRILFPVLLLTLIFAAACQNTGQVALPDAVQEPVVEETTAVSPTAAAHTAPTETAVSPTEEPAPEPTQAAEGQGAPTEPPAAATVEMICSEGDDFETCGGGPTAVSGEISSAAVDFSPNLYPEPTVALIDVSNLLQGRPAEFIPETGQILGFFTEPLFPLPGRFHISLPIVPAAVSIDVDNDGAEDTGVQIYALAAASNLINNSYLQQLEQLPKAVSYLTDVASGAITEGTFLVFAPDGEQGFPSGRGDDGLWFTADDPSVPLPAGYTLATLEADGTVTFDRSLQLTMNNMERAEQASPDFSDQGILESYESLIALLKDRYAYTELRQLDWDAIRAQYLPAVEEADANDDPVAYFLVLTELANSVNDTHVSAANTTNVDAIVGQVRAFGDQTGSGIGASTIAISDEADPAGPGDTIVVLTVGEGTPAAEAGMVPGTEIVSINGESPADRYGDIPMLSGLGTEEGRRVAKSRYMLSFPADETITVEYRLPGESEVRMETFVTGPYESGGPTPTFDATPVTFEKRGPYAVVRWSDFVHDLQAKLAVLQEALGQELGDPSAGIIIDMRGNGGGWVPLYETMASHFFSADDPMPVHLFDYWTYDGAAGEHLRQFMPDYEISTPRPELAFTGPLVILVDEKCVSSCEYFTQHLQLAERATVIGQYRSAGAGGFIERAQLPGGNLFQFTQGRTTLAGTEEPNLEAKGVVPDIRVPVTLETELAKLRGEDPVMDVAIAELDRQTGIAAPETAESGAGETAATAVDLATLQNEEGWMWTFYSGPDGDIEVENPTIYTAFFAEDMAATLVGDCNFILADYTLDGEQFTLDVPLEDLMECAEGSRSASFMEYLSRVESLVADQDGLLLTLQDGAGVMRFVINDPDVAFRVSTWEEATQSFLDTCDAPGAVMLVDSPQGRFLQAYGVANTEEGTPMQTDDRFEIGSNTKSFTAVLGLQLQEEGVWSLDDPLSQWLPDVAERLPNGEAITLRQLASNTSGVWDYANPLIGAAIEGDGDDLEQAYTPEVLIDYVIENGEPSFAPGEDAEYSSSNFILLGEAIVAATGESLTDLYQERIFGPLGMESSSLLEGVPAEDAIVNGYYTLPTSEVRNTTNENGSQMWAAGGIISTAEDMAKYAAALADGTLFQDPDSQAQMTAFGDEPILPFTSYGLGVGRFLNEPLTWGHGGQTAGFQTLFLILPESDTNVVLLTNSASCRVFGLINYVRASQDLYAPAE